MHEASCGHSASKSITGFFRHKPLNYKLIHIPKGVLTGQQWVKPSQSTLTGLTFLPGNLAELNPVRIPRLLKLLFQTFISNGQNWNAPVWIGGAFWHCSRSADFQVGCIAGLRRAEVASATQAGFQIRRPWPGSKVIALARVQPIWQSATAEARPAKQVGKLRYGGSVKVRPIFPARRYQ